MRVVDAEAVALKLGALAAGRRAAGDLVELLLAESHREHELSDIVQQRGQMNGVDRRNHALRGAGRNGRRGHSVHVHLPARGRPSAGDALQKAVGRRLEREARNRAAAGQYHRLTDCPGADRARRSRGVGEAQQVGRERLVALDRAHDRVCRNVGVLSEAPNLEHGALQYG